MKTLRNATALLAVGILLSACGGGGGGGGIAINYEGVKTPVQFDSDNAVQLGDRVYEAADAESTYYNPMDDELAKVPVGAGKALARRAVTRLASATFTGNCGGSVRLAASDSGMSVAASFSDYCSNGAEEPGIDTGALFLDGTVSLSATESVSGTNFTGRATMAFNLDVKGAPSDTNPIALTRGTVKYIVHGKDAFDTGFGYEFTDVDEEFTYNLLVGNPDNSFYIWFNDFVSFTGYDTDGIEDYYTVDGRIYFSDVGYVDVSTAANVDADGQSGDIRIKGANDSWLKIVISPTWNYQIYLETGDDVPPAFDDPYSI